MNTEDSGRASAVGRLRRELGTIESYAALLGILIGAGIFSVTSQAWALTGPSVILAYVVLIAPVLATSVVYAAYLSTPLGSEPGGEYTHISRTLGGYGIAFVGAWLKAISYIGALAFLANAFADHIGEVAGISSEAHALRSWLAFGGLTFFFFVHIVGVRWFGRIQVVMCALLGASLVVLIVPGMFAVRSANYRPFFTGGFGGFAASLVPLFFAYAGFESLAQTAGEVKDSTRRLPRVFLRGILLTSAVFILMSVVAFGVLPGADLQQSHAPMVAVASQYLPVGAAWFVGFGAVMAISTSMNATMLVPSRLWITLVGDRLAPAWLGSVNPRTGTPINGLGVTFLAAAALIASGQVALALNIAVFALVLLYFLHSLVFLGLRRANPTLSAAIAIPLARPVQVAAAAFSVVAMGGLCLVQIVQDIQVLSTQSFRERLANHSLTSLELIMVWGAIGIALYLAGRRSGNTPDGPTPRRAGASAGENT